MDTELSYWHSPTTKPYWWKTLSQILDARAQECPNKEIYVVRRRNQPRESITIKELQEKSTKLAAHLLKFGLSKGDSVIITGITAMNWIISDYACLSLGLVPLKSRMSVLTKEGLQSIVNMNKAKALFFHPGENHEFEDFLQQAFPGLLQAQQNRVNSDILPTLQTVISMAACKDKGVLTIDSLLASEDPDIEPVRREQSKVQPDDIASVYMTSGSTGIPKAIPHSHFAIVNTYATMTHTFSEDCRYFNDRSLSWVACDMFWPLLTKTCIVYVHPLTAATNNDFDYCLQVSMSF